MGRIKSNRKNICFYLSDHGFGHISRNIPIIAAVVKNDYNVYVVCGNYQIAFAKENLSEMLNAEQYERLSFRSDYMDIGLKLQPGTLQVDIAKLTSTCEVFLDEMKLRVERESQWLAENKIEAVLCDMPIWSIEACKKNEIPLLYLGNFTWTELYREFLPEKIWKAYGERYQQVKHGMLYALHNTEMLEFLCNAELTETSTVVRPFHKEAIAEIRNRNKMPDTNIPIVFVALGMSAQFEEPIDVSSVNAFFYTTEGVPMNGMNVEVISYSTKNTHDYVAAADYVITKAGWSTVAECLMAKKPMALFTRDTVLEDRTTIKILEEKNLAIKIDAEELKNVDKVLERMGGIDVSGCTEFYDATDEIAYKLVSLT